MLCQSGCALQSTVRQSANRPTETNAHSSSAITVGTNALERLSAEPMSGSGIVRFLQSGILEVGIADAPHTLTVFTDYHCRYCYEFQALYMPKIRERYIVPGHLKVRFVIQPLTKYQHSLATRQALLCAGAQGKGISMHEFLTGTSNRSPATIAAALDSLGIESNVFGSCLTSDVIEQQSTLQTEVMQTLGITLVPTFILDNEVTTGLPLYPDLAGWIDARIDLQGTDQSF
jgi:protein-disulfide isomerase